MLPDWLALPGVISIVLLFAIGLVWADYEDEEKE